MPDSTPPSPVADRQRRAVELLDRLVAELEPLQREFNIAQWDASVTGSTADAERRARLDEHIRTMLSEPGRLRAVRELRRGGSSGDAVVDRQLEVLERLLAAHQMPPETLKALVALETALDSAFNNYRAELDGRRVSDNELRQVLQKSDDAGERRRAWEASKQVGAEVETRLLDLIRLRNRSARELGYRDYYAMMLELDELEESQLFDLLDRVERGTRERFDAYRTELDERLSRRFRITPDQVRPWHLADPFFQEAPSAQVDLDRYFLQHDVVSLADRFFGSVGLPLDGLLARADLHEKPGKSQHAFCLSVDRSDDVRVLCNVTPTEFWMSVVLHEFGHAVYDVAVDRALPWLLRAPAHTLTTEASAMLFGRLSKSAAWLARYAGVDAGEADRVGDELRRATRDQLLVQARWCLVMAHMERELYRDPDQPLNALWWDFVERFQRVRRPEGRDAPDWASKIHFSVAPVYYHNYLLGEMLASQLQGAALRELGGWTSFVSRPELGSFLVRRLYRSGKLHDWRDTVRHATGEPLAPDAFVAELCGAE